MRANHWIASVLVASAFGAGCRGDQREPTKPTSPPAAATTAALPAAQLSQAEIDAVRYMREEEKLARDVYQALEGNGFVFVRIQGAERRHFEAIGMLLARYGVPDPASGKKAGEFTSPELQARYTDLVARGSVSAAAAFAVGLEIEEHDIADLERAKAQATHPDVLVVFTNLQRASRNHLRAFHRSLAVEGGTYTPKHLERATLQQIVEAPMEPGGMMGAGPGRGMGPGPGRGMGPGPGRGMGPGPGRGMGPRGGMIPGA